MATAPIIIPEIVLHNFVSNCLKFIEDDYNNDVSGGKDQNFLHRILNGTAFHKHDYKTQAASLFTRAKDSNRKAQVRMFFDSKVAALPTFHITMASDDVGENELGLGERAIDTVTEVNGNDSFYRDNRARRFKSTYRIVCTSDNHSELLLMYHVMRAMIMSAFDSINLAGLENASISGNDLTIDDRLVPTTVFARAINIHCISEVAVPNWFNVQQWEDIVVNGTIKTE